MSDETHQPPWKWREDEWGRWNFEDADGRPILYVEDYVVPVYVRRLTELAPEMEMRWRADVAMDFDNRGVDLGECDDAYNDKEETATSAPPPWRSFCGDTCTACWSRAMLAELDKVKGAP